MSKTFFEFLMTYRDIRQTDEQGKLANWAYSDHGFPKESTSYDELSNYLEWNSPFPNALIIFDKLWDTYQIKEYNNKI